MNVDRTNKVKYYRSLFPSGQSLCKYCYTCGIQRYYILIPVRACCETAPMCTGEKSSNVPGKQKKKTIRTTRFVPGSRKDHSGVI